ncbi:MAG: hypothetical protein ACI4DW_02250 [Lachnospiraceae bacterium]
MTAFYPFIRKLSKNTIILLFCILILAIMLLYPQTALPLVRDSILIWYQSLLPTLFPAMILSNIILYIFLSRKSRHYDYLVLVLGFLCGFPIGAYLCSKLVKENALQLEKGQYLLGFCNNLSPVYLVSVYCCLFPALHPLLVLLLFYGCPLCYGGIRRLLSARHPAGDFIPSGQIITQNQTAALPGRSLPEMIDYAISDAISSIVRLAGYVIFFRLFLLPLRLFDLPSEAGLFFGSLIEITSGIFSYSQQASLPGAYTILLQTLPLMTFGGICCIGQTLCMIKGSGLSILTYLYDKLLQSGMLAGTLLLLSHLLTKTV